jgi:hypothetical protein
VTTPVKIPISDLKLIIPTMNDDPISPSEAELTRWLDTRPGASAPTDLTPLEAARVRAEVEAVATQLRRHVPTSVEPPYPDFFNSHLLKRIRDDEDATRPGAGVVDDGWWEKLSSWLRSPWLVGAATAGLVLTALVMQRGPGGGEAPASGTRVLSVFSPEPNATARVNEAGDRGAVIITVDGLDAFPDDRTVVGLLDDHSHALIASHQP